MKNGHSRLLLEAEALSAAVDPAPTTTHPPRMSCDGGSGFLPYGCAHLPAPGRESCVCRNCFGAWRLGFNFENEREVCEISCRSKEQRATGPGRSSEAQEKYLQRPHFPHSTNVSLHNIRITCWLVGFYCLNCRLNSWHEFAFKWKKVGPQNTSNLSVVCCKGITMRWIWMGSMARFCITSVNVVHMRQTALASPA